MIDDPMAGCRVLVVEDEILIAIEIEDTLKALGCEVVGLVGKLDEALELAVNAAIDAAILDVRIRGGDVFPVAEKLLERNIPFILSSGYGDWALPEALRGRPRLTKPFTPAELEVQVRLLCRSAGDLKAGEARSA